MTCIIAFLAYIMESSYKSIEMKKEIKNRLFKYSMTYIFGLAFLCDILIISWYNLLL